MCVRFQSSMCLCSFASFRIAGSMDQRPKTHREMWNTRMCVTVQTELQSPTSVSIRLKSSDDLNSLGRASTH